MKFLIFYNPTMMTMMTMMTVIMRIANNHKSESANAESNWRPRRCWKPNPQYYSDDFMNTTNLNRIDGFLALMEDFGLLSDEGYYDGRVQELKQLETKDPWDVLPISEVPEGANILDSTGVFR
jgi:hypothetical protein